MSRCADNEIKVPVLIPVNALELDASTTSGFQKIGADERAVLQSQFADIPQVKRVYLCIQVELILIIQGYVDAMR